ncbi:MFS transporter [Streptomyces sp. 549]|uniref:MFS transporter n=1 Tax=Streptomyces sp. 549 TaxID=3049076 RepID=UPI0032E3634E
MQEPRLRLVGQRRPQRSPERLAPLPDGPRAHPGCREGSRQAREARQARCRKVSRNLPASAGRALQSFTTSIINIVGTVIAMLFVDRIGRKPLALIGSAGMAVSLGLAAWAFSFKQEIGGDISLPDTQGTVGLIAAHSFVLFFALSWGVVVWVMLGEIFPNRIRAALLGVAASAQWITNWLITASFPTMSDWNLSGSYVIYACFAALSIPFILKWVPETKGKALEDMG